MSTSKNPFELGIIEGFYGLPWSHEARLGYASFLKSIDFQFYIYAPKADPYLRKRWRDPIPDADLVRLRTLSQTYRAEGLSFGVGLSPFEIYIDFDTPQRTALTAKVAQLNEIGVDFLCVLFDDMKGDVPQLADKQIAVMEAIAEVSSARRFILCPTYYSDDPILERVFGAMPDGYLTDLGKNLDARFDLFWTGPKVLSKSYPVDHLLRVTEQLRRKPFLWDNYPVNDAERLTKHLHLRSFENRTAELRPLVSGHAANPMNQPWLSRIPLSSLSESYQKASSAYDPMTAFRSAAHRLCGDPLATKLESDLIALHDQGLDTFDENQKAALENGYKAFKDQPYAAEILEWLNGKYKFDPNCLTD